MDKGILMQCKLIQSKIQNAALGIISKLNVSTLVSMCKERKNFIEAAKYCWYDLVSTHDMYLQSLLDVGYALNQYVVEELLVFGDPPQVSGSDFETSEEDFHFEFPSFESESDLDSTPSDTKNEDQSAANMDYINDMKNGSKEIPCGIHGHLKHKHRSSFNRLETPQRMYEFPDQHMNWDSFVSYNINDDRNEAVPMDIPFEDQKSEEHDSKQTTHATPPPPVTTWDFLSLFSSNIENDNYYDNMKYVCNASSNNISDLDHLRQVREREGIPELEDETEQIHPDLEYETAIFNEMEVETGLRHSNKETSSPEDEDTQLKDGITANEEDINYETFVPKKLAREGLGSSGTGDVQISLLGTESLGTSSLSTPLVASCRTDFREAVQEIREEFQSIFNFGKEILEILQVGKRPYHCTKFKAFASRVLRLMASNLCMLLSKSTSQARLFPNADKRNHQEHVFPTSADLSSTMEKLCAWEHKLYVQVTIEEKFRILYDNQYKRLKMLDDRGSESEKIDDAMASIRHLHSKISVAIASITVASREIHKLRDHVLLPELQRLIEGLIRLWKFMATCHQKQFQVIMKAKSHVHIWHPHMRSPRASLRMKKTILNWSVSFSNLVNTQKAFVKYLNEWLQRCILHEPDQDEDIASPLIFTLCNDWCQAIDVISESGVSRTIDNFASSLHQLYEMLEQEQVEKRRMEKLLKDYDYRLISFHKENGMSSHKDSSFTNVMADLETEVPQYDEGLATSRQRLIEQRERCSQVVKQVNDAVSSCLEEGLSPIFEALGRFCLQNLQAYEKLILPKATKVAFR